MPFNLLYFFFHLVPISFLFNHEKKNKSKKDIIVSTGDTTSPFTFQLIKLIERIATGNIKNFTSQSIINYSNWKKLTGNIFVSFL